MTTAQGVKTSVTVFLKTTLTWTAMLKILIPLGSDYLPSNVVDVVVVVVVVVVSSSLTQRTEARSLIWASVNPRP